MSSDEKVLDFPRVEGTSEENARRVMVEATRLASLAPGERRLWIDRSAERLRIPRAVCAFLASRAEHPNTQARARGDVMFGCSDVRMFTTGWAAPRRRSACRTADVLALKSHNLDATTFLVRAPNFGDPAQRHRRFCAS